MKASSQLLLSADKSALPLLDFLFRIDTRSFLRRNSDRLPDHSSITSLDDPSSAPLRHSVPVDVMVVEERFYGRQKGLRIRSEDSECVCKKHGATLVSLHPYAMITELANKMNPVKYAELSMTPINSVAKSVPTPLAPPS
ncbi:hypothetical protein BV898_06713 [Hypsibius exemplaris]|uniref:Uncharacterized protein n=1 Tax=Hypsibius exemplaris TaxID=2072580 RepID=A0A1W0WVR3_HYPEX|nr:hypothetical protein BV898_06713 [Hypsibius exemplaris]